jgi:hypothetical protein
VLGARPTGVNVFNFTRFFRLADESVMLLISDLTDRFLRGEEDN